MKKLNKRLMAILLATILVTSPVLADATVGDSIISIGADLTEDQKSKVIEELDAENSQLIEVTNAEEHKYLGSYIPAGKIGSTALSNAKVTLTEKGSGINVKVSDNINYITPEMYRNALITAGITDADVEVTALTSVTGTGALTGIMKAYETITGKAIPEDVKQIANEEMVVTFDLNEQLGNEETAKMLNDIKATFAKQMPETKEEAKTIIVNISNQYNINLTDEQVDQIADLLMKMKNVNIDWNAVSETAGKYIGKAKDYFQSEKGQETLKQTGNFLQRFFYWIASLFNKE